MTAIMAIMSRKSDITLGAPCPLKLFHVLTVLADPNIFRKILQVLLQTIVSILHAVYSVLDSKVQGVDGLISPFLLSILSQNPKQKVLSQTVLEQNHRSKRLNKGRPQKNTEFSLPHKRSKRSAAWLATSFFKRPQ